MPPPLDLTGRRFGSLVVLGPEGKVKFGRWMTAWRVRCDCGRTEVYPQDRLPHRDTIYNTRHVVTACSYCRQPSCVVCGKPVPLVTNAVTCSPHCRHERIKAIQRDHYHRKFDADPEFNRKRHQARLARAARDPDYARRLKRYETTARRRQREREATDPAYKADRRKRARSWYAKNAARVQAKQQARLARMTPEQYEHWAERMRGYQRAYRRRWREELIRNPARHQAYLDKQHEYRRQRALRGLMTTGADLADRLGDTD